ncbi:unnamed protein product [Rotaria sordida]|uniref:Uncharacterized protein n=1 Tax=Rotaria sordida TaxID=392033 RepID=A0A815QX71_9BILA|nr:unnamed protein product [Rotaria sordida]
MSISYHFDHLPSNVLTLSGYDFFQFIRNTLGEPEANFLNKISVKTTSSFILIENPLDIFNEDIDDEELDTLKGQLCFKMKNDKFLIKPGVLSGFVSLKEALKEKLNQQHVPKKKHQQSNSNVLSISSLTSSTQEAKTSSLSSSEHKSHVLKRIKKWCKENRENLNLENFELEEDIDFSLNVDFDSNSIVQATIKCKCGKLITLGRNDQKIQVSNYYKHLQSIGCSHMKEIKKSEKQKLVQQQLQSTVPVSQIPTSQLSISSVHLCTNESINTQSTSNTNSISTSQPNHNAKRRIISESQKCPSTKRIRN